MLVLFESFCSQRLFSNSRQRNLSGIEYTLEVVVTVFLCMDLFDWNINVKLGIVPYIRYNPFAVYNYYLQ